jgi:hypothetical protein
VSGRLVVFARQPVEGAVKTRLTPPLDPAEATELYRAMLEDVLAVSAAAAQRLGLEAVLAVHPPRAGAELVRRAPGSFRAVAQRGPELAARMTWAVGEAGAAGAWPLLLRGSDSPALSPEAIADALAALDAADVVIVPDLDGGYSLVGLRRFLPNPFEHPMSTRSVAEETRAAAERNGRSVRVLAPSFDIDTAADLALLAAARAEGAERLCPRTLAYLDEHALWRHAGAAAQRAGRA